ncbi:uncharacterized protein LOC117790191 [Drosophila innubila]|uniref:uncharacterized protein LOC117790191 n=1 Tax=Drosophila innubila TaxID=198719 RepID=UPI00148C5767|nr:uncharacterized protein LOC117790191 [Drosophila innubila]
MDQICKFLSVDLCDVLLGLFQCENENKNSSASSHDVVDGLSYVIRHNYPKRLVTYDAEEIGEPRLIRISELTESVLSLILPNCKKNETMEADECEVDEDECAENEAKCHASEVKFKPVKIESNSSNEKLNKDKEKNSRIACNFLKSFFPGENLNEERLKQLEHCSKILHERFLQCQAEEGNEVSTMERKWESLKPMQKFCFYWQALTGHILYPTPFENFKDIFIRRYRRKCPLGSERELRGVVRRCWRCLKSEERVPFNLNALLYHVSTGKVDPFDHCAVRMLLNRWR